MEEACAIDDTGKDYQEYVIRISYDKAYDAVKKISSFRLISRQIRQNFI